MHLCNYEWEAQASLAPGSYPATLDAQKIPCVVDSDNISLDLSWIRLLI